jgi:hypothetical protein
MNKLQINLLSAICLIGWAAAAQDTNSLKTEIGAAEAQTDVVIVKGFGQTGSIAAGADEVSVRCKETTDIGTGQKIYGLAIEIAGNPFPHDRILVDDDEIDSLLGGINYLIKINYDVTSLPGFEASYATKAGLRVIAGSLRKDGGVQYSLQYGDGPRIPLSAVQISQFYGLVEQARKNLDALKSGK